MGLLASIATGIGTLGEAFFGKKSTDSANKTNRSEERRVGKEC